MATRLAAPARRLILALALLAAALILAPAAQAQGGGMMNMSPEQRADQRIGVLLERVQITPEQSEQLKPVLVKQFTEQVALFQKFQGGGDRQAMMGEMQALRAKYDGEIEALLNAEQKTRYQALLADEAEARRNRMRGMGGGQ